MATNERFTSFAIAACFTAVIAYLIRKRIEEERKIAIKEHPIEQEIDKEIEQDTAYADAEPDFLLTKSRTFTFDKDGHPILVVGVCGGSGSGKTTLARAIIEQFGLESVTYISHDFYYKDLEHLSFEQRAKHNYDHPDSLDTALLVEHLRLLRKGESVLIPRYDFATHTRCKESSLTIPKNVILVEGILIFTDPVLVDLMDIKIFVETPNDIRFIRRLRRDMEERGRSAESVMQQYLKTVRPMHMTFVEPSKRVADILIPQGVNAVALEMILSRLRSFTANI